MAQIRKTTEIDRSYAGALKEINRLAQKVQEIERDLTFTSKLLTDALEENKVLKRQLAGVRLYNP